MSHKVDDVETLVNRTLDEFKKVDILVNNAGILYDAEGPLGRKLFQESLPEEWHREIELILFGTLNCIKSSDRSYDQTKKWKNCEYLV